MERETKIENQLIIGDNLQILKSMPSEYVDLIYLDPPFCTQRDFIYFNDIWKEADTQGLEAITQYNSILHSYIEIIEATHSKAMKAYITYITQRMIELHRILKKTGSIYLHCDPTASHYLKQMMDCIFGRDNFRNEIVWAYQTGGVSKKWYAKKHDIILFYSKKKDFYFNQPRIKSYIPTLKGRKFAIETLNAKIDTETCSTCGEKGGFYHMTACRDVWNDINALHRNNIERLGYPTQKPLALLDRIIQASCPENGIVLDPFCGCGTTVISAQNNKRKWIGIDIEAKAVEVGNARLKKIT